jgi:predicted ABC-type ATPase
MDILQLHVFGDVDEDVGFKFVPLWQASELEQSTIRKQDAETDEGLINAGVLDPQEVRKRIAEDPDSPYMGLDVDDMPEPPDQGQGDDLEAANDPFGMGTPPGGAADAPGGRFEESKHPRGQPKNAGQFGPGGGGGAAKKKESRLGVAGNEFDAAAYARGHDDPGVTPEKLLSKFHPEVAQKVAETRAKVKAAGETIDRYRTGEGKDKIYTAARAAIHEMILFEGRVGRDPEDSSKKKWYPAILAPEKVAAAKPPAGQKPKVVLLGGRGGSGKSWFRGKEYDEDHSIVLDADAIKHTIEEYEGWNANEVHEESSDILDSALDVATRQGLNVVIDATMKSSGSVLDKVAMFKKAGYDIEAHYMHLPRQMAAERAVHRFMGKSGRFVPPEVVLGNTMNESNFNEVRKHASRWSFRDNNVARGEEPRLVAQGENDGRDEEEARNAAA